MPAPDTRRGPAPRVGALLLARPGLGPAALPCVVVSSAERHEVGFGAWRPLPYRATVAARRTAVALYLGGGAWAPAVLAPPELAPIGQGLAGWPAWRDALLGAEGLVLETLALLGPRGARADHVRAAIAAARATKITRAGGSLVYSPGV